MSLPSNGITPDVIREMMPPYHLSPDLLEAMFAAMPPPPPDASATWRQGRITRLLQEFSTLMPANAAQARVASQILIMRELADAIAGRAFALELTALQMCRVGRASAELVRTAAGVERLLERKQQKPAAFFGTVLADEVDVAAVDAAWGKLGVGEGVVPQAGAGVADALSAAGRRQGGPGDEAGDADGLGERGDLTAGTAVAGMAGSRCPAMTGGEGTGMAGGEGTGMAGGEMVAINLIQLSATTEPVILEPATLHPDPVGPVSPRLGGEVTPGASTVRDCVTAPFAHDADDWRDIGVTA